MILEGQSPWVNNNNLSKENNNNESNDITFTDRQIFQVQQQIQAYKLLIRNLDIPKELEKTLYSLTPDQWSAEKQTIFNNQLNFYNHKIEKSDEIKVLLKERILKKSSEPQPNLDQIKNTALNFDLPQFLNEKNQACVDKRISEIQFLLNSKILSEKLQQKLYLELLFLQQRDIYLKYKELLFTQLSEDLQENLYMSLFEKNNLDRQYYKKERIKRNDNRLNERFELNMIKHEQERRKKQKYKELVNALFRHQTEFFEFHRRKNKNMRKRRAAVKMFIDNLEKKKTEMMDKAEKERIKVLKNEGLDKYMEFIKQIKNDRIIQILKQTDEFLRQIGAKVKIQKGEKEDDNQDLDLNFKNQENIALNLKNSNRVYYNLTHTIKEDVFKQPSLLEGGELKSYQLVGLKWLLSLYNNNLNGILADEMGLGKTIQTIALLCYLMEFKKNSGPFLIIVPLSTLSNWLLEFDKWAPSIKKIVYKGIPQNRKEIAKLMKSSKWNVCLTTYEYILKDRLTLSKFDWKYIIVDEGHRMKNSKSKFAYILGQQYTSDQRLLLTGTPLQNNLQELWALLNFLLPRVFESCEDFEKWFTMPLGNKNNEKELGLNEEEQLLVINRLHQVLRPFLLRRVKKEVESELPNKIEYVIKVELSAWQKFVYKQIESKGVLTINTCGKIGARTLQNIMMQLRKIANHPYLFLNFYEDTKYDDQIWRSSGKFELLDRMLPKLITTKHRVLIFSQMTQLMDIMEHYFEYRQIRYLRLDGSTKAEDRAHRINLFNSPNSGYDIFLLSTRAGGLGLNLQSADTVFLFDSDWNPQMDLQAQDRAYRIGQKNEVKVYRLVTKTWIEEEILSKAAFKMNLDEMIIQAGLFNQKSTDYERNEKLQDLLKKKQKDGDEDDSDEIPSDELINEWLARGDDEFEIFQEMDRNRYEKDKEIYENFKEYNEGSKYQNYRLSTYEDIPNWIKRIPEMQQEKVYGRGNRTRKYVNYQEGEYMNQFLDQSNNEEKGKRRGYQLEESFESMKKLKTSDCESNSDD